ncbi:MAG TPA: hypothetical protein VGP72_32810 [Planctomycetota bacterium]|jgi:hypothetical protein
MEYFPRTTVENVSVSRMLIGINWFLGYSHTSAAKDAFIREYQTRERLGEILKTFMKAGVDTVYGIRPESPHLLAAIQDAEQATGRKAITIALPTFDTSDTPQAWDANARMCDAQAKIGATFCLPHQATTDAWMNRITRKITHMDRLVKLIRERGMVPGLSTHTPEVPVYADESGLDVATYIQIYNPLGFLMQIEIDWVHRMIWNCKKPVIVIKPMAAGRCLPIVGLGFVWGTIRDQDMVCVGTMLPDEAKELVEISTALLERRKSGVVLQRTRSKESVELKK